MTTNDESGMRKYTSSSEDIKKTIKSNEVHCLLPRNCRESFIITFPNTVSEEGMNNKITESLKQSMPNSSTFILCMDKINVNKDTTGYNIVFLNIHKELINNLFLGGIKTANFYVGYSENTNEYPLLDGPPLDNQIAKYNRENKQMPYKVSIQLS